MVKFADVRTKEKVPPSVPTSLPSVLSNLGDAKVLGMLQQHQRNCNAAVLTQAPSTFPLGGIATTPLAPLSTLPSSTSDLAALTFLTNLAASVNPATAAASHHATHHAMITPVGGSNGSSGSGGHTSALNARSTAALSGLHGLANGNFNAGAIFSVKPDNPKQMITYTYLRIYIMH